MQGSANDVLVIAGAIRVSRINEVDAKIVYGVLKYMDRMRLIRGRTPHAITRQMHRAIAEAVDDQVAAKGQLLVRSFEVSCTHDTHSPWARICVSLIGI